MTRNSNRYAAKSVAKTLGKCQYCRERIKKKAVKCKHCGESQLSGAELASYAEEQIFDNRLVALRAIAIWWFVWVLFLDVLGVPSPGFWAIVVGIFAYVRQAIYRRNKILASNTVAQIAQGYKAVQQKRTLNARLGTLAITSSIPVLIAMALNTPKAEDFGPFLEKEGIAYTETTTQSLMVVTLANVTLPEEKRPNEVVAYHRIYLGVFNDFYRIDQWLD